MLRYLKMLQNTVPGREPEEKFGMPVAMIRLIDKVYSLTTGNLILNEKVDHLKEKLDTINKYDKAGLKELFRKSLSGQTISSDSTGIWDLLIWPGNQGVNWYTSLKR